MINEDFDLGKINDVDWTDTFADSDDNAVDDKIREFIDKYVEIVYINRSWRTVYVTPSFAVTADGKVELRMPDGEPLSNDATVRIQNKDRGRRFIKPREPFGSIKDKLCGMSLADMPDNNFNVINIDIEHLYGLPDSVGGLWVINCDYLADLSGIPKNVNGDLRLYLNPSTRVNTMPERIKSLYIGDGYFELTKDVIDMLPYNIKYIMVRAYPTKPDQDLLSLLAEHLDKHRSAPASMKVFPAR